jgi:lipopolysaccharide heptosyltransferase II
MKFIGDVVLTTPLIRSLRNACPDAFIAYMGEKHAVSLLEHNPCLDEIIPFDYTRPAVLEQSRVALTLRARKFDLAIDLFGNPRSALLTFLSGADVRIGPERKGRGRLYTITVKDDGTPKSAVDFHFQSLRAAGIEPSSWKTEITLTDDERRDARIYLQWLEGTGAPADTRQPIVAMHPGATWPAKKWLAERYGQLADLILAKTGARVIVLSGPNDGPDVDAMMNHAVSGVQRVPVLPLRQLAGVISQCAAFVGNDAGPMHIAAALGVPTVGLFGPGEENIWFPYDRSDGHEALRKDVPCHPCHLDLCNRQEGEYMECMKLLGVEEVCRVVVRALGTEQRG